METSNKVKFGLKNVYYAVATFDEDGEVTYGTPTRIPGAVSISLDAEGEPEIFYADDIAYYVISNNSGYTGDLEIALVPDSFREDVLKETVDANGVYVEKTDVEVAHFALLFEFTGDVNKIRHVFYNCTCSRPAVESATIEDSKEVQTESLSLVASALANGYVKAKTSQSVDATSSTYTGWYDAVYVPTESAA